MHLVVSPQNADTFVARLECSAFPGIHPKDHPVMRKVLTALGQKNPLAAVCDLDPDDRGRVEYLMSFCGAQTGLNITSATGEPTAFGSRITVMIGKKGG